MEIDLLTNSRILQVIELLRYYPEKRYRNHYKIDESKFCDVYDVVLTDGNLKRKFVLTADVRVKYNINPGSHVRIIKFESISESPDVIVIQQLEVVQNQLEDSIDLDKLQWTPDSYMRQKENIPLISNKLYYADLSTYNVNFEKLQISDVKSCSLADVNLREISTIKDVMTKKVSQYSQPQLLVQVMRRSKLVSFMTTDDKWPFQVPLMVADKSAWCPAVLWSSLGLQLLNHLQEGTVLLLKNFHIKSSRQVKMKTFVAPPRSATCYNFELSLDVNNPTSHVVIVNKLTEDEEDRLNFPPLESCLMTRKDLLSVPDLSIVDVAGYITFVGQVERERMKGSSSSLEDSGGFFYRRWIHVKDYSLDEPIIILVYAGTQKEVFFTLKPSQQFLFRHMLTKQQLDDIQSSRGKRYGWLTTTTNSWLYSLEPSEIEKIPKPLKELARSHISKCSLPEDQLYLEGGIFRYPPFASRFSQLGTLRDTLLEMTTVSRQWKPLFDKMVWQQCQQLVVNALFVSMSYENLADDRRLSCSRKRRHSNSFNSEDQQENSLGSTYPQCISQIWPVGKVKEPMTALVVKWEGINNVITLNTIKPVAIQNGSKVENLCDFLSGVYDSDLGLVRCGQRQLTQDEVSILTETSVALSNCHFMLLLDVYTDEDNQQIIVLNRAYVT